MNNPNNSSSNLYPSVYGSTEGDVKSELLGERSGNTLKLSDEGRSSLLGRRATDLLMKDVKRAKGSIFAETLTEQVATGVEQQQTARSAMLNIIFQVTAFTMAVAFASFSPFLKRALMEVDSEGNRTMNFIPPTLYLVDYMISLTVGNFIALVVLGLRGVKMCWEPSGIIAFCPVMLFASIAEALEIFVLTYLDATSWRIVKQMKLPMCALAVYFFIPGRRNTTAIQWFMITSVTIGVLGYCASSQASARPGDFSMKGVSIAMASVSCTVAGSVLGDFTYKKLDSPLYCQIPMGRITSFVCILGMTIFVCVKEDLWYKFPFGGWSYRAFLLALWLCVKDWTSSYILKHLDSIWKSMCTILSLCVAYILDVLISGRKLEAVASAFIICIMINMMAFAHTKREIALKEEEAKKEKLKDAVKDIKV